MLRGFHWLLLVARDKDTYCIKPQDIYVIMKDLFEDTKGVIRIRKSKDRQHNGQKKMYKRTSTNLQNVIL
jgi:peptidyl-tRNA hydrolase